MNEYMINQFATLEAVEIQGDKTLFWGSSEMWQSHMWHCFSHKEYGGGGGWGVMESWTIVTENKWSQQTRGKFDVLVWIFIVVTQHCDQKQSGE